MQAYQGHVGNLIQVILPVMTCAYVLAQCHRVIRWGNQMQKAGVPLNIRPVFKKK